MTPPTLSENTVIILCGGLGTRLKDALPHLPKGLAPINDVPFLDRQLQWLASQGLRKVILAIGHKADQIKEYFKKNPPQNIQIEFSEESTPLGTGGAVLHALANTTSLLSSPHVFVMNGDTFCDISMQTLYDTHLQKNASITLALTPSKTGSTECGNVTLTPDGHIHSFTEKTHLPATHTAYINLGIYCITQSWITQFASLPRPISIEKDIFQPHLTPNTHAFGAVFNASFIDIGTPETLKKAGQFALDMRFIGERRLPRRRERSEAGVVELPENRADGVFRDSLTIISQHFYPELISTGQSLTELAETFSDLGITVTVLSAQPTLSNLGKLPSQMTHHRIQIKRVWSTTFPKLNLLGKLLNHLTFSCSILWTLLTSKDTHPLLIPTNPPFLAGIVCLASKLRPRPIHYAIYDVYPDTAVKCKMLSQTHPIVRLWQKINQWIYSQVTSIIVIGKCMETLIKTHADKKYHSKIHYIPLWADTTTITPAPKSTDNPFVKKWQLQGKYVVLYSGNMGRFHDITTIIQSAKQLHKSHPDILFVFVGDGQKKQALIEDIKKHHLTNCQVHPYVDRDQLHLSLGIADVGLVTLLPEFSGISIPSKTLGIMASKRPVIALLPKDSEMSTILTQTHSGIVIPPLDPQKLTDAILTLKATPTLQTTLAENGYTTVQTTYTRSKIAREYLSLIFPTAPVEGR